MFFIQLIPYCLYSWYYVVYPAGTIATVIVSTQYFAYVTYILQDSYNCFFNDYNFFLFFLSDTIM